MNECWLMLSFMNYFYSFYYLFFMFIFCFCKWRLSRECYCFMLFLFSTIKFIPTKKKDFYYKCYLFSLYFFVVQRKVQFKGFLISSCICSYDYCIVFWNLGNTRKYYCINSSLKFYIAALFNFTSLSWRGH